MPDGVVRESGCSGLTGFIERRCFFIFSRVGWMGCSDMPKRRVRDQAGVLFLHSLNKCSTRLKVFV